jgi:predicted DNA-binding transcriptional regulator AlpA
MLKEEARMQAGPDQASKPNRLISFRELSDRLGGLSRTTIWRMQRRGDFPRPIPISPGRVCWDESAVDQWVEGRINAA